MSAWVAKRFWVRAGVVSHGTGFTVKLDDRDIRTPLKTLLVMPSRALAEGVAMEWDAQAERIDPLSMPLTRAVNATLDKVVPQQREVAANLADYGGSDLLCYRAPGPDGLVARQRLAWNPMLDWAETTLGARLRTTEGVMPVAQAVDAMVALRGHVDRLSPWELTALSEFVTLTGSLILGLAAMAGREPEALWTLSRVDEDWQAEQWGLDAEEAERIAGKRDAFLQAARFLELLRKS